MVCRYSLNNIQTLNHYDNLQGNIMHHQDPYYYFFIVPLILLVVQVLGAALIWYFHQIILKYFKRAVKHFEVDNSDYRIVTRKEAEMRAHKNEQERMVSNHAILTQQGDDNND